MQIKFKKYDVIIVGAGIAGLYAAINSEPHLRVLVLSKKELMNCNTALAQGGIVGVFDDFLTEDTLKAGKYENNRENLRIMVEQGEKDIANLIKLGIEFDREPTLEGGHSKNRILHCKDSTGEHIITALLKKVKSCENIEVVENAHLLRLEKQGEDFFCQTTQGYYTTNNVVLATGGIGCVYNYSTNSDISTGDGIAFAYKLGANIKRMDLIQFHPTAFIDGEFLISEAVRGEGAYILNENMQRFCDELAPRDIVSRCIIKEEEKQKSNKFYLDISHKDSDSIKNRFPMIYEKLLKKGYDLTKEPIPIYPCQHYLMGGIAVTSNGETNVTGLYAVGECAFTGVHGANRLASNSLLEALVFSRLAACGIVACGGGDIESDIFESQVNYELPEELQAEIKNIMQRSYFVIPDYEQCRKGLKRVKEIMEEYDSPIATVAYLILSEVINT